MIIYQDFIYLISIIILLLISAFFSASETSMTTTSQGKIHHLAKDGNRKAKMAKKLLNNKDALMATILIGNNVVNILASAIATSFFIKYFGGSGVFYATIVMTFLIFIFSEITPKTYAIKKSEKTALLFSPLLLVFSKIFFPLTFISKKITDFIIGNKEMIEKSDPSSHLNEIRGAIELKHIQGDFLKSDKDMINGILDLKEVEISEILTHRKNIKSINIDQNLSQIIKESFKINHTKIPLWKNNEDNIVKIINIRKLITLVNQFSGDLDKIKLDNFTSTPLFVPPQNTIGHQLKEFKQKQETIAIVIDEYGTIDGLVTISDIIEEIIGEFSEKESKPKSKIIKLKNNIYQIPGSMPIRDINRELNWDLKENDDNSSTIAGFVITNIEKIPEEKEEFEFDNFWFKIIKKKNNQLLRVNVKKIENKESEK